MSIEQDRARGAGAGRQRFDRKSVTRAAAAFAATLTVLLTGCSTGSSDTATAPTATTTQVPAAPAAAATPGKSAKPADTAEYRQDDDGFGRAGYFFTSPSGAFSCAIFDASVSAYGTPVGAACQGRAATPAGAQGCAKSEGLQAPVPGLGVGPSGTTFFCNVGSPLFTTTSTVLPYDSSLTANGYTCHSAQSGVSCQENLNGKGFRVSRESSALTLDGAQRQGASVTVPDVRGERPAAAENLLTNAGLTAKIMGGTGRGPRGGQCVVAEQEPAAGTKVATGALITLTTREIGYESGIC
ncbi:PASTA domain-containing protein [Nocardia xishanensis]|uniref:PASTA domain-containing protein n=1 Tax=Nocardia xishanensis TaxID=238964 RepID=UPI000A53F1B8|nr:PASTA domain-containing protein [Nocardia xishanensis]